MNLPVQEAEDPHWIAQTFVGIWLALINSWWLTTGKQTGVIYNYFADNILDLIRLNRLNSPLMRISKDHITPSKREVSMANDLS